MKADQKRVFEQIESRVHSFRREIGSGSKVSRHEYYIHMTHLLHILYWINSWAPPMCLKA